MNPLPEPPEEDQPLSVLIFKGVLLIIGAFLTAPLILSLHYPSGH